MMAGTDPKQPLAHFVTSGKATQDPMEISYMTATRFIVVLFLFITCDSGFAQDSITNFDESEVKAAVEEIGVLDVCPDQALLKLADLEVENCRNRLSKLAVVCWHIIDPVIPDYEIQMDENNKEGAKDRIISLSLVYSSCVRSELLRGIVKKRKENNSG